jgi:hypothetical protein
MTILEELKAALTDPSYYRTVGGGLLDAMNRGAIGGLLGAPVDMANGLLNAGKMAAGYVGHKTGLLSTDQMPQPDVSPLLGSEWWGQKMQDAGMVSPQRNAPAEFLAGVAGIPAMTMATQKIGPALENAVTAAYRNAMAPTPYNRATGGQAGMVNFNGKNEALRDSLGLHVPRFNVSGVGSMYSPPKYYVVESTAENIPEELMSKFQSIDDAERALTKYGISFTKTKDVGGYPKLEAVDQFTLRQMNESQNQIDRLFENAKNVYLRYGDIPQNGLSKNHIDNTYERGVSVFNGLYNDKTGQFMTKPNSNQELGSFLAMRDRPVYLVEGEPAGFGSDGEPLLTSPRILKMLRE